MYFSTRKKNKPPLGLGDHHRSVWSLSILDCFKREEMQVKPLSKYGLVLSVAALIVFGIFSLLQVLSVKAQQSGSVTGSPSATQSLDTRYLPPPPPRFGGVINPSAAQSQPWWPPTVVPPKG